MPVADFAVSDLWWRFSERVRVRLRSRLGELTAAEATLDVLGHVLDEVEHYDPEQQPLMAWRDAVVDRYADDRDRLAADRACSLRHGDSPGFVSNRA